MGRYLGRCLVECRVGRCLTMPINTTLNLDSVAGSTGSVMPLWTLATRFACKISLMARMAEKEEEAEEAAEEEAEAGNTPGDTPGDTPATPATAPSNSVWHV